MCNDPEIGFADIIYARSNSNTGYIYLLDIKYKYDLKQKTKKYPFFPEKTNANFDKFTDGQKEN